MALVPISNVLFGTDYPLRPASEAVEGLSSYKFTDAQRLAINRALSDIYLSGDVGRTWTKWFEPFGVKPTSLLLELYRLNSFSE